MSMTQFQQTPSQQMQWYGMQQGQQLHLQQMQNMALQQQVPGLAIEMEFVGPYGAQGHPGLSVQEAISGKRKIHGRRKPRRR